MLSGQQLAEIELDMIEEHRKDIEALERLKRFLPKKNGGASVEGSVSGIQAEHNNGEFLNSTAETTEPATNDIAAFLYQHEI